MLGIKWINIEVWFILLLVTGYTVFSAFAIPLHIENSRIFAVPYRIIVFFFSIYIVIKNFSFKKLRNIAIVSMICFWLLYFFKSYLSFTTDSYDLEFLQKSDEVYVRILIIAVLPSIALLLINYKKFDFTLLTKYFFYVLMVMLTLNMIFALVMPHGKYLNYIFSIYYISYGHLGTSMVIISLFLMLFRSKEVPQYLMVYGLILGITTIVIAGARSPFLAIMVVVPYLLIVKKDFKLIIVFIVLLLISVVGIYFLGRNQNSELMFVNRTYLWFFEGDNSLRTPLFERAIEIFKSNPFFGGRTHYENGSYPHNIFLELLMATGIVGFITYMLKFIPVVKNFKIFTYQIINYYHILFFALFLQYFVLCSTSFTLYSVPEFLYFSSIIIGISLNSFNEENESNDGRRNPSRDHQISESTYSA